MKIKVDVKKQNGEVGWTSIFDSQDEADAWILEQTQNGSWGSVAYSVTNEDGSVTDYPAEFTVEQSDVTAVETLKTKQLTRKEVREGCLDVIDFIATYNKDNLDSAGFQALAAKPWFVQVGVFLLLGAPDMAKGLIQAHGTEVYSQGIVDAVVALLNPLI